MTSSKALSKCLVAVGLALSSPIITADTQGGSLAAPATSKSYWRVNCFDDGRGVPSELVFNVTATTKGRKFGVSATVSKDGQSQTVTDPKSGDKTPSPWGDLTGGGGDYVVEITKSRPVKGTIIYSLTYHCQGVTGDHTGTTISRGP